MKYFKLKATLILAILLCNISASAYTEIWQNNIKYTLGDDGTAAVNGISRITAAIIPEKVTYDGIEYAVTSIKEYAFAFCSNLASVAIPSSVTSLEEYAFADCYSLTKLVCNATTPPACRRGVFKGIDKSNCTLIVPQESLDAYKSAAQWKSFFNITTGIKNVPNTSSSATESERYSTDGTRLASPQKGINIIRMSDGTVKKVLVK